ncbi:MAG: hypothetical protein IKJ89_09875, partial [Kiritimatiellae bacterium]|nr:hypothetical protein [Kiritimatiellia bacterium]
QDAETKAASILGLTASSKKANDEAEKAEGDVGQATKTLAALEKARADLYSTKKTQDERNRLNQAKATADRDAAEAKTKLDGANTNLENWTADRGKLTDDETEAKAKTAKLRADFDKKRAAVGFATDADWKAAQLDDETVRKLVAAERNLNDESVRLYGPDGTAGEKARLDKEAQSLAEDRTKPKIRRAEATIRAELAPAETAQSDADQEAGAARNELAAYDALAEEVAKDKVALAPLEKAAGNWDALDTMLGGKDGKNFQLFAQRLNFRNLVCASNPHLQIMSGRRYRFAWESERPSITDGGTVRKMSLFIADAEQAGKRPVSTLSGGESFFASLALALGFSSLRGGCACENLFLDEGFGTLDDQSLGAAVEVLKEIGVRGTLVGVVTHVEEVVEASETVIEAVQNGNGTSFLQGPVGLEWSDNPGEPPTPASADGKSKTTT